MIQLPVVINNIYKIKKIDIPQPVKVRKYQVDIKGLQELLRNHKNMSNKQISNELNVKKQQ